MDIIAYAEDVPTPSRQLRNKNQKSNALSEKKRPLITTGRAWRPSRCEPRRTKGNARPENTVSFHLQEGSSDEEAYRKSEEAVGVLQETRKGIPPSEEGRNQPENAGNSGDLGPGNAVDVFEVGNGEKEEGDVKEDEERAEGDGRLEGTQDEEEGKDEPSKED